MEGAFKLTAQVVAITMLEGLAAMVLQATPGRELVARLSLTRHGGLQFSSIYVTVNTPFYI